MSNLVKLKLDHSYHKPPTLAEVINSSNNISVQCAYIHK